MKKKLQNDFHLYQIYHKIKHYNLSKILYIDDSSVAILATNHILKSINCLFRCVSNLDMLFFEIEEFHPDIFIIDIVMPKYNGIQIVNMIKEAYPNKNAVYIATSVLNNSYDLQELSRHFDLFIPKPIEKTSFEFLTIGDEIVIKDNRKPNYLKNHKNVAPKINIRYSNPYPTTKGRVYISATPDYQNFLRNIQKR